jgi:methyltransferase (TIGR00027 family)
LFETSGIEGKEVWRAREALLRTARWTAAARARESERPDRLFDDPFARAMANADGFELLAEMEPLSLLHGRPRRENPYFAIRTRFFDDFLTQVVAEADVRQIVMMAAGFDTRAYRIDWPDGTELFEIDRDETFAEKEAVLVRLQAQPRCDRHVVNADLTAEWESSLILAGFDPARGSVWTIEGLLAYLDETMARRLTAKISALAGAGARLCADLPGRDFFDSPLSQPYLSALARKGMPWKFGTDEPEAFFDECGWAASARRPGEEGADFGRWPYPLPRRGYPGLPTSFFVTATRKQDDEGGRQRSNGTEFSSPSVNRLGTQPRE